MIGFLVSLLILLLVLVIFYKLAELIIGMAGAPAGAMKIVQLILLLILVIWLANAFTGFLGAHYTWRW